MRGERFSECEPFLAVSTSRQRGACHRGRNVEVKETESLRHSAATC